LNSLGCVSDSVLEARAKTQVRAKAERLSRARAEVRARDRIRVTARARARAKATRSETHRSQIKLVESEDRELVDGAVNLKKEGLICNHTWN